MILKNYLPPVPRPGKPVLRFAPRHEKGPRKRGPFGVTYGNGHHLTSAGNFPPFAASLVITCLCSQIFMVAESLVSPV